MGKAGPTAGGQRVIEQLVASAKEHDDILDDPGPVAAFDTFDDRGMVFALRAWPHPDASIVDARNDLAADAICALDKAGIEVARTQRDVRFNGPAEVPSGE